MALYRLELDTGEIREADAVDERAAAEEILQNEEKANLYLKEKHGEFTLLGRVVKKSWGVFYTCC